MCIAHEYAVVGFSVVVSVVFAAFDIVTICCAHNDSEIVTPESFVTVLCALTIKYYRKLCRCRRMNDVALCVWRSLKPVTT